MTKAVRIRKWSRVTGTDRAALRKKVVCHYMNDSMSIREICIETGRSYGAIHLLLREAGVAMRTRGRPHKL